MAKKKNVLHAGNDASEVRERTGRQPMVGPGMVASLESCSKIPNAVTRLAITDVEQGTLKRFCTLAEAFSDLGMKS